MRLTAVMTGLLVIGRVTVGRAETGKAMLMATSATTGVSGTVMLQDTPQGLKIDADIAKAPAGEHAFHIHEFGVCDDQGKAAGSHYNPAGHQHGNALKDGIANTHAGDFGSIRVGANGMGSLHGVVPGLALSSGPSPVAGRAFILHEKMDDFSQPVGNAGSRIGCGPIVITGK